MCDSQIKLVMPVKMLHFYHILLMGSLRKTQEKLNKYSWGQRDTYQDLVFMFPVFPLKLALLLSPSPLKQIRYVVIIMETWCAIKDIWDFPTESVEEDRILCRKILLNI